MKRPVAIGLPTLAAPRIMCAEKKETPDGEGASAEAVNSDFKAFEETEAGAPGIAEWQLYSPEPLAKPLGFASSSSEQGFYR